MLAINNNWKREQEIDEKAYPNMVLDYNKRYSVFPRQFRGETFGVKVILATEKNISYQTQKGKTREATVLELTVILKNPDDGQVYYYTGSIFSEKEYQSNELHDFLMLCIAQNPNALNSHIERTRFGVHETLYPNICGCNFKINIATTGFNKDGYEKQNWKIYNMAGLSQEEIENGITQPAAIVKDLEWLQGKYQEFQENKFRPQKNPAMSNGYGQANRQQPTQINSFTGQPQEQLNDDLPF